MVKELISMNPDLQTGNTKSTEDSAQQHCRAPKGQDNLIPGEGFEPRT